MSRLEASMKELRELTPKIREFGIGMFREGKHGYMHITAGEGRIVFRGLMNKPKLAIVDCWAEKGASMEKHTHPEIEIITVYTGEYHVTVDGELHILKQGDTITIPPSHSHSTFCAEDCYHIAQTIPASPFFPEGVIKNDIDPSRA